MKKKVKRVIAILLCIILMGSAGYFIIGNPVILMNNQKLKKSIQAIDQQTVYLNEVIPFAWDILYTFEPYSNTKEDIEEVIGFKSDDIKVNNINEGMVHLLFVKGDKVVASVLGYSNNLGYSIDFTGQITHAENAQFNVETMDDVITLIQMK